MPLPSKYVVFATAQLDQDPGNNDSRNLLALCQRCHLAQRRVPRGACFADPAQTVITDALRQP